jgi:hypothetical protein
MPGLRGDEMRAWKALLLTLEKVIPCEDCRSHVKSYVAANPVNIPDNYQDARNWIRRWLWTLHEEVNSRLHHNSFPYETLDLVYGGVDFKTVYGILNVLIERAIRGTAVGQLSWNNWNKYVKRLFGMYN